MSTPTPNPRALALRILDLWEKREGFADALLHEAFSRHADLPARDRHLVQELVYGVLRQLLRLDFLIDRLASRPLDPKTRNVVRLGLYQILETRVADHAAVNESVALGGRARGMVNAVLRRFLRERDSLVAGLEAAPLAIRVSHPEFLLARWSRQFGPAEAEALAKWNNSHPPPLIARINLLNPDARASVAANPGAVPVAGWTDLVDLRDGIPPGWIEDGICYIQDSSTLAACDLLDPQAGERVLDACAAPGGKTAYLAQKMGNSGQIVACDTEPHRLKLLGINLSRLRVDNVVFTLNDWGKTGQRRRKAAEELLRPETFDRILLDVPCSNTGVMRRRVDVRWRLRPDDFLKMQAAQLGIVRSALPLLKRGGTLVYSTCSLEPEENEDVVGRIRKEFPSLVPGGIRRLHPWNDATDGAFAASFQL